MEPASNAPSTPKRYRLPSDNPFCDSSDTCLSDDESPQKKMACSHSNPTNSTDITCPPNSTQQDILANTNQLVNNDKTTCQFDSAITFNGDFDDFNVNTMERNKLIADFKKVMIQFQRGDSEIEGVEEIEKTLQDLGPLNDVVYLYVRFAGQQPTSNFNTDSLCSLLCVAKQSNVKPYVFLTKIKTIELRNNLCKYGVSFSLETRNTRDVDGVLLEKKFLGLKYTLQLLQSTVTKSEAILGKANDLHKTGVASQSKRSSLYSKLWLGIGHRWLAYHIIDHLFSLNKASSWTNQEIFVFSIRIFASCGRSRYDFLKPLVGLCLRFQNHNEIDLNQDQLATIRADPKLFLAFGNTSLRDKNLSACIQSIYETFSNLKKIVRRKISYRSLPLESKWLLLKAYAYQLWLEQSQNKSIKSSVLMTLSQENCQMSTQARIDNSGPPATKLRKMPTDNRKMPPVLQVKPTPCTMQPANVHVNGGLEVLLQSRKKFTPLSHSRDCHPVNNIPDPVATRNTEASTTSCLTDMIIHSDCDWSKFRLLSTNELDEILSSYLIIRRDDGIDLVSRLSSFEIYSADNLHKFPHCRLNGSSNFYPTTSTGQVVLNIGNKIEEFVDVSSKTFHIAREGSDLFRQHGKMLPHISDIATLCQAVIVHGNSDSKRCAGQRRAFIGNGGLDFPNGIPTTIVDGGFRKKLNQDPTFSTDQILQTIGRLSEFLWSTMVDMQQRANDSPMAPDRRRHQAYSNHLCTLLSMGDCVSFEHITLVVSTIYPTASDLVEHIDSMNDSAEGYTRTGTLNMCFVMESTSSNFKVGIQVQVIGTFRRVIRQYLERTSTSSPSLKEASLVDTTANNVGYEHLNSELREMAYTFGQSLRKQGPPNKIIYEGRKSRRSDGAQSYSNHYSQSKVIFTPYRFKVATFCDKKYASRHDIQQVKVLGHMERPQEVSTQVNAFHDYKSGQKLLEYLQRWYCRGNDDGKLENMRSATYHQQIVAETQSQWTIFEGHVDKSFVHTAWFVPLTGATFYTFIAVPCSWNVTRNQDSELMYQTWVSTLAEEDQDKIGSFQEHFEQQAKVFMKDKNIQVLIYLCTGGSFLSFPANLCYHATVAIQALHQENPCGQTMKDLLIFYPMERG